jgi:hypothetical protein
MRLEREAMSTKAWLLAGAAIIALLVLGGCSGAGEGEQGSAGEEAPGETTEKAAASQTQTDLGVGDTADVGAWRVTLDEAITRGPSGQQGVSENAAKSQKAAEEKSLKSSGAEVFLLVKVTVENTGQSPARLGGASGPWKALDEAGQPLGTASSGTFINEMKAKGSRDPVGGFGQDELVPGQPRSAWHSWGARLDDSVTLVFDPYDAAQGGSGGSSAPRAEWELGRAGDL